MCVCIYIYINKHTNTNNTQHIPYAFIDTQARKLNIHTHIHTHTQHTHKYTHTYIHTDAHNTPYNPLFHNPKLTHNILSLSLFCTHPKKKKKKKIEDAKGAADYVERVKALPAFIAEIQADLRERHRKGHTPPRCVYVLCVCMLCVRVCVCVCVCGVCLCV